MVHDALGVLIMPIWLAAMILPIISLALQLGALVLVGGSSITFVSLCIVLWLLAPMAFVLSQRDKLGRLEAAWWTASVSGISGTGILFPQASLRWMQEVRLPPYLADTSIDPVMIGATWIVGMLTYWVVPMLLGAAMAWLMVPASPSETTHHAGLPWPALPLAAVVWTWAVPGIAAPSSLLPESIHAAVEDGIVRSETVGPLEAAYVVYFATMLLLASGVAWWSARRGSATMRHAERVLWVLLVLGCVLYWFGDFRWYAAVCVLPLMAHVAGSRAPAGPPLKPDLLGAMAATVLLVLPLAAATMGAVNFVVLVVNWVTADAGFGFVEAQFGPPAVTMGFTVCSWWMVVPWAVFAVGLLPRREGRARWLSARGVVVHVSLITWFSLGSLPFLFLPEMLGPSVVYQGYTLPPWWEDEPVPPVVMLPAVNGLTISSHDVTEIQAHGTEPGLDLSDLSRCRDCAAVGPSWYDVIRDANARSVAEGLTPAYRMAPWQVTWNPQADGYRLPSDDEVVALSGLEDPPEWTWLAIREAVCEEGRAGRAACPLSPGSRTWSPAGRPNRWQVRPIRYVRGPHEASDSLTGPRWTPESDGEITPVEAAAEGCGVDRPIDWVDKYSWELDLDADPLSVPLRLVPGDASWRLQRVPAEHADAPCAASVPPERGLAVTPELGVHEVREGLVVLWSYEALPTPHVQGAVVWCARGGLETLAGTGAIAVCHEGS